MYKDGNRKGYLPAAAAVLIILVLIFGCYYRDFVLQKVILLGMQMPNETIRYKIMGYIYQNSDTIFLRSLMKLIPDKRSGLSLYSRQVLISSPKERYGRNNPKIHQYIQRLEGLLRDKDPDIRYGALFVLTDLSKYFTKAEQERIIPEVLKRLEDDDEKVIMIASEIFRYSRFDIPVEKLISLLESSNPHTRIGALSSLCGKIYDKTEYHDRIIQMLRDENPSVRKWAAGCIYLKYYVSAADELIAALDDPDKEVRLEVIKALMTDGSYEVTQKIKAALLERLKKEKDEEVHSCILDAIEFKLNKNRSDFYSGNQIQHFEFYGFIEPG